MKFTIIVVKGRAAVDDLSHAIVFTQVNTTINGMGNTADVITVFHTQFFPFNCLNTRLDTNPPAKPHIA
jgi:hypothetical protein